MGICINYSGSFKKEASLKDFIEEVKDTAIANNWQYHIFNDTFKQNQSGKVAYTLNDIYGINITPPNCESVTLTFLSNRKMMSSSTLAFYLEKKIQNELEDPEDYLYSNYTKTQYAGYQIHKQLCTFFKYIAPKYFNGDFEFKDETNFYVDNNEEKLKLEFERSSAIISMFSSAFDVVEPQEGESIRDFLEKVGNIVSNNLKDKLGGNQLSFEIQEINLDGKDNTGDIDDNRLGGNLKNLDLQ